MTNQQHPITLSLEMVGQWADMLSSRSDHAVFSLAAQCGADQELEACCEWLSISHGPGQAERLRAARRPKPPSLKEQAIAELDDAVMRGDCITVSDALPTIRRALEAQAGNLKGSLTSSTPPPVATDEELDKIWNFEDTWEGSLRAVYNLGIKHGQAGSWEVAEPAPVAGEMAEVVADLRIMASEAFAACQFSDGETLTRAANMLQQLSEQEAGR